jgi:hypothetical protein
MEYDIILQVATKPHDRLVDRHNLFVDNQEDILFGYGFAFGFVRHHPSL